jgi:hypothetical protein
MNLFIIASLIDPKDGVPWWFSIVWLFLMFIAYGTSRIR